MATVKTMIARTWRDDAWKLGYTAEDVVEAAKRVRITKDDRGRLLVAIFGEVAYRTDEYECGLWRWGHGAGDATWTDGRGNWEPVESWHQIIGTCQISGREQVRGWVVEAIATELDPPEKPPTPLPANWHSTPIDDDRGLLMEDSTVEYRCDKMLTFGGEWRRGARHRDPWRRYRCIGDGGPVHIVRTVNDTLVYLPDEYDLPYEMRDEIYCHTRQSRGWVSAAKGIKPETLRRLEEIGGVR